MKFEERARGTGRTTRMLQAAAMEAENGEKVLIIAANQVQCNSFKEYMKYCSDKKLNIEYETIHTLRFENIERLQTSRRYFDFKIFIDHWANTKKHINNKGLK